VFAVEQQPVEAATGQGFGHVGVGKANPAADDLLTGLQRLLEGVEGEWQCRHVQSVWLCKAVQVVQAVAGT
jgi:hypothetical protein